MTSDRWLVIAALSTLAGCQADANGIPFHGEAPLLDAFEWDSGFLPEGSPAQVRVAVQGGGGVTVDARGTASGDSLAPSPGTGSLQSSAGLMLGVHAKVDVGTIHYEGVVQEVGYDIPLQTAGFEPFVLDGANTTLDATLPPQQLLEAPIPSVPGSTLILSVEGGTLTTTFAGTCAAARGGFAQYLGRATVSGTVDLSATIRVEVPFSGTQSFGPFPIQVAIPAIERDVDLGTFEIATSARVEGGASPCSEGPTGDGGAGGDGGVMGGDGGVMGTDGGTAGGDGAVGRVCRAPEEPPAGRACDYATLECVQNATSPEAFQMCLSSDSTPDLCQTCFLEELRSCANRGPCAAEYQAVRCCADDHCAGLDDDRFQSCIDAFCPDEESAWYDCVVNAPCPITELCFRAPG